MWKRFSLVLVLVLAIAVTMASGCSGSSSGSDFNAADVSFVQQMIPHHQQAVEMSDLAPQKNAGPQVSDLAAQIKSAQGPEIAQMKGWLKKWHKSGSDTSGHGGMSMSDGMMSSSDMSQLKAASGAGFDRMFLTMMITHHQGAVKMARTEQASGKNADAKKLAGNIIRSQEAEIATMQKMLTAA